jgi:hypothetical protein
MSVRTLSPEEKGQIHAGLLADALTQKTSIRVAVGTGSYGEPNVASGIIGYSTSYPGVLLPEKIWAVQCRLGVTAILSITQAAIDAAESEKLEQRFREQATKWGEETEHLSSPTQMMMHPSYQAVLGMARGNEEVVVRLLLRDLRDNRRMWFWALSYLTKANPIRPSDAGKLDKMIKAWVDWGAERGLI